MWSRKLKGRRMVHRKKQYTGKVWSNRKNYSLVTCVCNVQGRRVSKAIMFW